MANRAFPNPHSGRQGLAGDLERRAGAGVANGSGFWYNTRQAGGLPYLILRAVARVSRRLPGVGNASKHDYF